MTISDASYIYELRRPDSPDVWDWWEPSSGGIGCRQGYAWSNLPGFDASKSEEGGSIGQLPIVGNPECWGDFHIPLRNEEVEIESNEALQFEPNKEYVVEVILKRKLAGISFVLTSESEFCGKKSGFCEFNALSHQEDETHTLVTLPFIGTIVGVAKKKFMTMSSINVVS